jgi:hypothetical protein
MPIIKNHTTKYEFDTSEIEKLIIADLGVDTNKMGVKVDFVISEISNMYITTSKVTKVVVTVSERTG